MLNFLVNPIIASLGFLYSLTGNLGIAIIILTVIIRSILVPITLPSLKSAKKMQSLKPEMDKLKHKITDKQKLQLAQLELYKKHGINPMAGCLPQIVQIIVLIALYQAFNTFMQNGNGTGPLNMTFLWLDLSKPDNYYILPVLAGLSQFILSVMMLSGLETHVQAPKNKNEKQKEEDNLEMAQTMQQQMTFMMPLMTVVISLKFPSGLALYWFATTVFSVVQQYFVSGLGGLKPYLLRLKIIKK
jgi:YidC/Oxa1 family membrane protein insertase